MERTKRTPEEKKIAQAEAHRRWRESEKGKAYKLKQKMKKAGVKPEPVNINDRPAS